MSNREETLRHRQSEAEKHKRAYETHGVKEACEQTLRLLLEYQDAAQIDDKALIDFTVAGRKAFRIFQQVFLSHIADGEFSRTELEALERQMKGMKKNG